VFQTDAVSQGSEENRSQNDLKSESDSQEPELNINTQVSISTTFYSHLFCTKVFCAAFI